jgi:hypothetical protein
LSPRARLGRLHGGYGESRAFCSPLTQENSRLAEQIEGLVGLALAVLITRITNVLARLIWRQEYLDSGAIAIQSQQHRHGGLTKAIHIK